MEKRKIKDDFQELDKIIEKLENQKVDLEESMRIFEKGSELIKSCHGQLKNAKNKFQEIKENLDEEFKDS